MASLRTKIRVDTRRSTRETVRAIGSELRSQREDAGISQARLARAAGIGPSTLCRVEAGDIEPSIHVLAAVATALGGRLRVRFEAGTGTPLRDHLQARMIEALLRIVHPRWRRFLEVPVYRPVRGVIDMVIHDPAEPTLVAIEAHSQLRRLEAQVRWAHEKAVAVLENDLGRAAAAASGGPIEVSTLLVLRSTAATREVARRFEATLATAYPASAFDTWRALTGEAPWPGSGIVWARVDQGEASILQRPPRGVSLGR